MKFSLRVEPRLNPKTLRRIANILQEDGYKVHRSGYYLSYEQSYIIFEREDPIDSEDLKDYKEIRKKAIIKGVDTLSDSQQQIILSSCRASKLEDITCYGCLSNDSCIYAYDPYNTYGDCLALK